MRILIEGVGGVGGIVAARLTAAGYNPVLVTGNAEIAETINKNGISAKTTTEEFQVLSKAVESLDALDEKEPFDAALLIMKANRVVEAASAHGVDVDELATRLQREGRDAFVESWRDLLGCLESRRNAIRAA